MSLGTFLFLTSCPVDFLTTSSLRSLLRSLLFCLTSGSSPYVSTTSSSFLLRWLTCLTRLLLSADDFYSCVFTLVDYSPSSALLIRSSSCCRSSFSS